MKKFTFLKTQFTGLTTAVTKSMATLGLLALGFSYSQAATYYVNDASTVGDVFTTAVGNNSNSGSSSAPFLTVSYAISVASSGDIIRIDAGTYNEHVTLFSKALTFIGAGSTTIFTPSTACVGANNGTFDGFRIHTNNVTLRNVKIMGYDRGIVVDSRNIVIRGVESSNNCTSGIELGNGLYNLHVSLSTFNSNKNGIRASTGAQCKIITFDSCIVNNNELGTFIGARSSGNNTFDTVAIKNSTFSGNTRRGMYFEKLRQAFIEGNTLTNNGNSSTDSLNAGLDINLMFGSYSNIQINNNSITNCGALGAATNANMPCAMVIKGRDDGSLGGSLTNVSITNNYIQGPRNGLRIGQIGATNNFPTNVTITGNSFGNGFANKALINLTSLNYTNATCNWFGTINTAAISALKTGNFTTTPFLVSGTDASGAVGFQPTSVTLTVNTGVDKTVYYGYTAAYNTAVLTAAVSGGSGSYSYSWSPGGATTASISVLPTSTTNYTCTVTDLNGCVNGSNDAVTVNVIDVRCSNPSIGGTVLVCQATLITPVTTPRTFTYSTQCVAAKNVPKFIPPTGKGYLGSCTGPKRTPATDLQAARQLYVFPNPSTGLVNIVLPVTDLDQNIRILNAVGQVVYETTTSFDEIEIDLSSLTKGIYYVQSSSANGSAMKKLILE
jgi:hypothetical protein